MNQGSFSEDLLKSFYEAYGERYDKSKMPCNKPRPTKPEDKKSHVVKWCHNGKETLKKFGEKGAATAGKPKPGESEAMKEKRKRFKSRHARNIAKGPSSSAWWADKWKWNEAMEIVSGKNVSFR